MKVKVIVKVVGLHRDGSRGTTYVTRDVPAGTSVRKALEGVILGCKDFCYGTAALGFGSEVVVTTTHSRPRASNAMETITRDRVMWVESIPCLADLLVRPQPVMEAA